MQVSEVLSRVALGVATGAFGLAGALSLRAEVEPLYAVVRGIIAFAAVLWLARFSAGLLDALGTAGRSPGPPSGAGPTEQDEKRRGSRKTIGR